MKNTGLPSPNEFQAESLESSACRISTLNAVPVPSLSTDGGQTFTKNIQISAGTSNSRDAQNGIDYGDYSGLSFYGGIAHPAWSDNSNSTGNNPDGTLHQLDFYSASVPVRWR